MNLILDTIICGVIAVGAAFTVKGINDNADAIDDILVAMLNKEN